MSLTAQGASSSGGYPSELAEEVFLRDGDVVVLRPVRSDDGPGLERLHGRLSKEAIYFRYFSRRRVLPKRQLDEFTQIDYRDRMGFVVEFGGELIAHACYHRRAGTDEAEVAFEVQNEHWGRGLATLLLERLAFAARSVGILRFTGHVMPENHRMLEVLRDAGLPKVCRFEDSTVSVVLDLGQPGQQAPVNAPPGSAQQPAPRDEGVPL